MISFYGCLNNEIIRRERERERESYSFILIQINVKSIIKIYIKLQYEILSLQTFCFDLNGAAKKKYIRKKRKDKFYRNLNRRGNRLLSSSSASATTRNNAKSGKWKPVHFLRSMSRHRANRTNRWIKWTAKKVGKGIAQSRPALNPSNKKLTIGISLSKCPGIVWRTKPRNWDAERSLCLRNKLILIHQSFHRNHHSRKFTVWRCIWDRRTRKQIHFFFYSSRNHCNKLKGLSTWRNSIFYNGHYKNLGFWDATYICICDMHLSIRTTVTYYELIPLSSRVNVWKSSLLSSSWKHCANVHGVRVRITLCYIAWRILPRRYSSHWCN